MHVLLTILLAVSPYLARVYEYMPAPGQFTNAMPAATTDDTPETMAAKAEAALANNAGGMVCLGAWGGYIVFGFDHPVTNSLNDYDFRITGNASYASYAKDTSRKGGAAEPGIVMVSYDANGNGLPDDPWYELAGSEYNSPATVHRYAVTYTRPDGLADIPWTDNRGGSGVVPRNSFHQQDYFPLWAPDELTFTGSLLAPNAVDDAVIAAMNEGLAKVVDNAGLKDYAVKQWVNISSMSPEDTEAYYAEQYDLYANYLADYID